MSENELNDLLQKYYLGETTLNQEQELMEYFNSVDFPEKFKAERAQFLFFKTQQEQQASEHFTDRLESRMQPEQRSFYSTTWFKIAAAFVLVLTSTFLIKSLVGEQKVEWNTISTNQNEKKEVELPDGSQVWINANSTLIFPEEFDQERRVELQGEAFFDITRDETRAFVIKSQNTETRVLGTSFNVRSYEVESQIEVIVVSGKVAFKNEEDYDEAVTLEPGLKGTLYKEDQSMVKAKNTDLNFLSWKTNELNFENQELYLVLESVGRHYQLQFAYDKAELAQCPFTGAFKDLTEEEVIKILSFSLEIEFEKVDDIYMVSGQGCDGQ